MELPVTLIVKAPNQQIEDQTVQCELSWTINKLKQHLSEVYPSKPPKHEQKLIYSGQLLNDSVILKDILRQYEGQDTHTVHLVCTPKYSSNITRTTVTTNPNVEVPNAERLPEDNLRREDASADQRIPNMQWYNNMDFTNGMQAPNMQNLPNLDPQMMQMLMMQQAFIQAYYTQYMHMNFRQNYQVNNPDQQQEQAPVPPPQPANNLPRDNPEVNRDWLDVFYILSRTMIFISIVYFYSSPVRCFVVVALAFTLYLYQIGFFRNVNINNNNIVAGEAVAPGGAQQPVGEPQEPPAPTRLMVLWTFFTTFFASLLPEIPNVV